MLEFKPGGLAPLLPATASLLGHQVLLLMTGAPPLGLGHGPHSMVRMYAPEATWERLGAQWLWGGSGGFWRRGWGTEGTGT